jgi:hypothetical protein
MKIQNAVDRVAGCLNDLNLELYSLSVDSYRPLECEDVFNLRIRKFIQAPVWIAA